MPGSCGLRLLEPLPVGQAGEDRSPAVVLLLVNHLVDALAGELEVFGQTRLVAALQRVLAQKVAHGYTELLEPLRISFQHSSSRPRQTANYCSAIPSFVSSSMIPTVESSVSHALAPPNTAATALNMNKRASPPPRA